ncbi:MAG: DUF4381 domain-containing protein [Geminicoccaceae bacterium]
MLQNLRDIHLPEQASDATAGGFIFWPLTFVAIIILLTSWLAWRRRSAWRREIVQHLDAIERRIHEDEALQGWTELATLLRRIAIRVCDKREVAGLIGDAWLERLDRLFETDVFARGPGHGITTFPYSTTGENDRDQREHAANQLRLTIDDIRKHLRNLKMAI